ncbi:MAG TPA: hypothetical protein VFQ25_14355 [Ktedonobacterales bacterium]|nr:hypothetical protein [Ktedonobacterales bacterium]
MPVWVRDDSKSLISIETIALIQQALAAGPIFGYWYRAHSGAGPTYWMARDFAQFQREIAQAWPADYYVIWSLPALLELGVALAAARHADIHIGASSLLSPESLEVVKGYLSDPAHEYIALFFSLYGIPEVWAHNRDGLELLMESAEAYNKPGGEAYVFPFSASWSGPGPSGYALDTIERPEYWLLEAQYPNQRGEVLMDEDEDE